MMHFTSMAPDEIVKELARIEHTESMTPEEVSLFSRPGTIQSYRKYLQDIQALYTDAPMYSLRVIGRSDEFSLDAWQEELARLCSMRWASIEEEKYFREEERYWPYYSLIIVQINSAGRGKV